MFISVKFALGEQETCSLLIFNSSQLTPLSPFRVNYGLDEVVVNLKAKMKNIYCILLHEIQGIVWSSSEVKL